MNKCSLATWTLARCFWQPLISFWHDSSQIFDHSWVNLVVSWQTVLLSVDFRRPFQKCNVSPWNPFQNQFGIILLLENLCPSFSLLTVNLKWRAPNHGATTTMLDSSYSILKFKSLTFTPNIPLVMVVHISWSLSHLTIKHFSRRIFGLYMWAAADFSRAWRCQFWGRGFLLGWHALKTVILVFQQFPVYGRPGTNPMSAVKQFL